MKIADWTDQRAGESTLDYYRRLIDTAGPWADGDKTAPVHAGAAKAKLQELLASGDDNRFSHFGG